MLKAKLIMIAVRVIMGAIALGVGIWYLSSSISGASLTYTSVSGFLNAIGAGGGDIGNANGCFLCGYIQQLFAAIGLSAEKFWTVMVDHLWIVMAIGFGIFLFVHTAKYLYDAASKTTTLDDKEKKLEFQPWFDRVWRTGARIMIVGVMLGALGVGGTTALRTVTNITVTPVMLVGAELSMAASGVNDSAHCGAPITTDDVLNPVLKPFMCVMGNLNSVMLAGAAGGFSMMNYAWLGMGGGAFTWMAGLALVILFLIIGFDLFFQVLSVVFKLVFIIIFLPLFLAAAAFEGVWAVADGVVRGAINMLVKSAVRIVAITLKVLILYATISYAADATFPGPVDGYSAVMPPLMGARPENPDAQTLSVINVFKTCEQVGLADGQMDADKFRNCFTASRAAVERRYPGAFDFMGNGWEFLMVMFGLFFLYYYVINPKIDGLLGKDGAEKFDFGGWMKQLGQRMWDAPKMLFEKIANAAGGKK